VFILPYGHDRHHDQPIVTILLIALNVLVFAVGHIGGRGAGGEIERAAAELKRVHNEYPDARLAPTELATLPPEAYALVADLEAEGESEEGRDGTLELRRAVRSFGAAVDKIPDLHYGYRPGRPRALTVLTSMFIHADIFHLLGNMLFLWLTGAVIESFWRHGPMALMYFVAGAAGVLGHHLSASHSMVPLVGASGAIAGLMGAYVIGHPRSRIKVFYAFWIVRIFIGTTSVPAWVLIPAWLALQVGYGLLGGSDGTAYWAHVGGFVAGVIGTFIMRWGGWVFYDADEELVR
jgi:membrane associated rhomboid family serine protease